MHTFILSERNSIIRKIRVKAMTTSLISILLAIGTSYLLLFPFREQQAALEEETASALASELISGAVPSSILEPFATISPLPLIILAMIVTYAFCSMGKYFAKLEEAVNVCFTVFSRMLGVVFFVLPFFFFTSSLELLLIDGGGSLLLIALGLALILAGTVSVLVFYLIRLKAGGVRLRPFLRKLPPLILENCRINSSIDAVPFNIRYCVRNYGMDRKKLTETLPFLAQVNFDGNCFLLMSIAMYIIFDMGVPITWYGIAISAVLVFFLSLGAPNQPGSILIGMMILLQYHGIEPTGVLAVVIYFEAFLGIILNLINTLGDIVTVAAAGEK